MSPKKDLRYKDSCHFSILLILLLVVYIVLCCTSSICYWFKYIH